MTKRALALLLVAVVFAAGAAVAIATSVGGDDGTGTMPTTDHRMDDGEMMDMGR